MTQLLEGARQAFRSGSWRDACARFAAADREEPLEGADLEWFATAAYLVGEYDTSAEGWGRAHQAYLHGGNPERAARCAVWLASGLFHRGERARGSGWIARARRLIDERCRECVERGYLLVLAGFERIVAGDLGAAHAAFSEATTLAEQFGDRDLTALARHSLGRVLIRLGEIEEGVSLLDEAMAAVEAGEVSPLVVGEVYCSVVEGCVEVFDLRRAQEWTEVLTRWCQSQPDLVPYRGQCLVRRAEILQFKGAWTDALADAEQACRRLVGPPVEPAAGAAFYVQAELLRLRGEFEAAEEAYRQAHQWGRSPHPGLALLRMSQGRIDAGASAIRRALLEARGRAPRCRLLPAGVEILLAAGDADAAQAAADELAALAGRLGSPPFLRALADQARGAVLLDRGDSASALELLRSAWAGWQAFDAAYEAARVRVLVALACRNLGDDDAATLELEAARNTFRQLGAAPDLDRIRVLAHAAAATGRSLTAREQQVLRLVAGGATNKDIAADLAISERTVERHVSNIFDKLRVSSRAAATAAAYERRLL